MSEKQERVWGFVLITAAVSFIAGHVVTMIALSIPLGQ